MLAIRLLGGFKLALADGESPDRLGPKPQALLAFLAMSRGEAVSRGQLAGLLWGERDEEHARHSLSQALTTIRATLGPAAAAVLQSSSDGVRLAKDKFELDVDAFERMANSQEQKQLHESCDLYQGEFLQGVEIREPGLEDWLLSERYRLGQLAADAFSQLLDLQIAQDDGEAAIETARRLIAIVPLDEPAHARLIALYGSLGRRGQAEAQYERCVDLLRDELDQGPGEELKTALAEARHRSPGKRKPALELPDKPSIAVLPFDNMSGDSDQEFFADGMAEDIITALSRFRWLLVIARNSTFTFKGRLVDAEQVAKELGVRYVLEGSIRKGGNRIRLTAQLIDARTGNHIWAERYDRELEDVFAVQDEITEAIVAAIAPEISAVELKRAERKPPDSLNAWDFYQRGLAVYYTTTEEGLESAIELFDKVNDLDTEFAPAFAMAAEARFRYLFHFRPDNRGTLLKQAHEKSQKGIALDSRDPVCLLADGRLNTHLGQHDLAISEIKEAIVLNPNYAMAHYALGFALRAAGRAEESISHFDRAIRLSPHDAFLAGFQTWRAMSLFDLKRYGEAVEWAHRASRNPNPRFWTFAVLAAALTKLGHEEEAQKALDEVLMRAPRFSLNFVREASVFLKVEFTKPFVEALRNAGAPERK